MNLNRKLISAVSVSFLSVPIYLYSNQSELYSWGNNSFGQLGLGHSQNCALPQKLSIFSNQIFAQGSVSAAIVNKQVCEFNQVYLWGSSKSNLFSSLSPNSQLSIPTCLTSPDVKTIALSPSHIALLTDSNDLFILGSNSHGESGVTEQKPVV